MVSTLKYKVRSDQRRHFTLDFWLLHTHMHTQWRCPYQVWGGLPGLVLGAGIRTLRQVWGGNSLALEECHAVLEILACSQVVQHLLGMCKTMSLAPRSHTPVRKGCKHMHPHRTHVLWITVGFEWDCPWPWLAGMTNAHRGAIRAVNWWV